MSMKLEIKVILFFAFYTALKVSGQTIYINPAITYSSIDLTLVDPFGNYEERHFQKGRIAKSLFAGIEYFQKKNYSLASEIGFFQASAISEKKDNWQIFKIQESIVLNNFSVSQLFNFNLLDRKTKIQ